MDIRDRDHIHTSKIWTLHVFQNGYYFNEQNSPFTVREEKIIHSSNEVRIILILSSACSEMLAIRMTYVLAACWLRTKPWNPTGAEDSNLSSTSIATIVAIMFHYVRYTFANVILNSSRSLSAAGLVKKMGNTISSCIRWIHWMTWIFAVNCDSLDSDLRWSITWFVPLMACKEY